MNVLVEVEKLMELCGIDPSDVQWVGTDPDWYGKAQAAGWYGTWEDFREAAEKRPEDLPSLVVVGPDWWIEVDYYNGSKLHRLPKPPVKRWALSDFGKPGLAKEVAQ